MSETAFRKVARVVLLAFFRLLRRPTPMPTQSPDPGTMVRLAIPPTSDVSTRAIAFCLPAAIAVSANCTNCWNCAFWKRVWMLMVLGMGCSFRRLKS